jgi:glutaminase
MPDAPDNSSSLNALLSNIKSAASPFRTYLKELHAKFSGVDEGRVADYIPELARANAKSFGICIVTTKGTVYEVGEFDEPFTIQSVSKAFMYGLALGDMGREKASERVGVEPTAIRSTA